MKRLAFLILIIGLWGPADGQTLESYSGYSAAQLSAMTDRVTVPNTAYWNTHAYLQTKLLIDRVLRMYSADSTTAYVTWDKLSAAVQDSILSNLAASSVTWSDLIAAVRDSIQLKDRISTNGVTYAKIDTGAAGWIDVRKFGAVGDSTTNNAAAIRAALKYASAQGGGIIFFPGGNDAIYGITDTLRVYDNITLTGDGAWIKQLGSAGIGLFVPVGSNVTFDHINIDGNYDDNYTIYPAVSKYNIKITNCKFKRTGSWSIRMAADSLVTVANNYFINTGTPIGIWTSKNVRVENNIIDNRTYAGATWGAVEAGITIIGLTDSYIVGNTWYRDADSVSTTDIESIYINDGAGASPVHNVEISGNKIYCYAGKQFGISLSGAGSMTDVLIEKNYIEGSRTIGAIELGGCTRVQVVNNTIYNTHGGPDIGINGAAYDLIISGNTIYNGAGIGISSGVAIHKLTVDNNHISSNADGAISLTDLYNATLSNNVIDSCKGIGFAGDDIAILNNNISNILSGNSVFDVSNSRRVLMAGNIIKNTAGYSTIYSSNVYDLTITKNEFTGCKGLFRNSGSTTRKVVISENTITNPADKDIPSVFGSKIHGLMVTDNKLFGGISNLVNISSASGDTVRSVIIKNNTIRIDTTAVDRASIIIQLADIKNAEISGNSIYAKHGLSANSSWSMIYVGGNSDSCRIIGNSIIGDSSSVWDTDGIQILNEGADYCVVKENVVSGFVKGIDNDNVRATNIVTDNHITNCTTAYEQAGGALGIRSQYYNAADSSMATIIWNPTLTRIDTVFAKQP